MGKSAEVVEQLNATIADLRAELNALEAQLEESTSARQTALKEATELRAALEARRNELLESQAELEKEKARLGEARGELNAVEFLLRQAQEQHELKNQSLGSEIVRLELALATLAESSKADFASVESRLVEAQGLIAKTTEDLNAEKELRQKTELANAELAKKNTATSEELESTVAELETARYQVSELETENAQVNEALNKAAHSLDECLKQLALAENKIVQLREEISEKEEDYVSLESNFDNIGGECSTVKRDLASIVEKFHTTEDAAQIAEGKAAQLADDLEDKIVELANMTDTCTRMESELTAAKDRLEELTKKLQVAQEDNKLRIETERKLEERLAACEQQLVEQKADSSESSENAAELARKVAEVDAQRTSAEKEAATLRATAADLAAQLQLTNEELRELRAQCEEVRAFLASEVRAGEDLRIDIATSVKERNALEGRVAELENLSASQETSVARLNATLVDVNKEYPSFSFSFSLFFSLPLHREMSAW
jgi:chromosome segregation ATPase